MKYEQNKIIIIGNRNTLTLDSLAVDGVFVFVNTIFFLFHALIKALGCLSVSIVHTNDAMAPARAHNSITLAKEF